MATIADISNKTGLSYSTVAEILRERPGYKPATRRRVLRVAEKLGYRPNPIGKALAGGKSMSIGLISAATTVVAYTSRLVAINAAAREKGYTILTVAVPPDEKPEAIQKSIQGVLDRRVDGLVVTYNRAVLETEIVRAQLDAARVPVVFLSTYRTAPTRPNEISSRLEPAAREIAARLNEFGHRRAIFVYTTSDRFNPRLKAQPYIDAFAERGMTCVTDPEWTIDPKVPSADSAYEIVSQMIRDGKLPTVLIMTNDTTAMAAMAAAHDAGLRVPDDVSIVGFDDGPEARFARPALTTVHQPGTELGTAAFDMLLTLMNDPSAAVEPRTFDCHAVIRDSIGPARRKEELR